MPRQEGLGLGAAQELDEGTGPRGLAAGKVELTSRRTGESEEMSPEAAVDRIAQIYAGR